MSDVRQRFPYLAQHDSVVYLDSGATSLRVDSAIAALAEAATAAGSPGRGSHRLAGQAAERLESARTKVASMLGRRESEIAFCSGATQASNAFVDAWAPTNLRSGWVAYSESDHRATTGPWLHHVSIAQRQNLPVEAVPIELTPCGAMDMQVLAREVDHRGEPAVVIATHIHNVYGERTLVERIRPIVGSSCVVVVDAAQSVGHCDIAPFITSCDVVYFSGHKMFAPPGSGVLSVSERLIDQVRPSSTGGGQPHGAATITEIGTLNLPAIAGLDAAIDFISEISLPYIEHSLAALTHQLINGLRSLPDIQLLPGVAYGGKSHGFGIVSFRIDGIDAADVGFVLDDAGIAVRTGSHCTLGMAAHDSVRISAHVYNSEDEIDQAVSAIERVVRSR